MQVTLSKEAGQRISEYAATFGISIESAASKAINRWMDNTGEVFMDVHIQKQRKKSRLKLTLLRGGTSA